MKRILVSLTVAAFVAVSISLQATLLMYEPFDYPAGDRLGGSGISPVGKTNANGQVWITLSPASGGTYDPARDTLITTGNLSYAGLATSIGNSVRYGSNAAPPAAFYTDGIAIPGAPYTEGSVYYSMIVQFHSMPSGIPGGVRTSYATLSEDFADPSTNAGYGIITSSGTGNIPLPAGAWIRNHATVAGNYQLGSGKQNGDGMGPSASLASWQSGTVSNVTQHGETTGNNQPWATIETNTYFIVMKYTFVGSGLGNDDTVSMWINPIPSTLGDNAGEAEASLDSGSYYSATNATVTANIDAYYYGIQSFLLIGSAQASASLTKTVDVSVDELRIGTTWADVTPVPPPPAPQIIAIDGAGTASVSVTWTNVLIGTNYVLQYSTNLSTTNWTSLAPVAAAGPTASQSDNPPAGTGARFYRVLKP